MLIVDPWEHLRELTAARIALGRAGHSIPTRELLGFQLAHARARDAVHAEMEAGVLAGRSPLRLKSAAGDRATYLRRPDLGRMLSPESAAKLARGPFDAAMIVCDGLSALAVHRYAGPLLDALMPELDRWTFAPLCVVEQGRVAVGDEIGELLGASLVVVIIGERPGLSSPDSLGVYVTWDPRVGRTDAERNCISNIRTGGLDPALAAKRLAMLMRAAREKRLTGTGLKMTNLLE